MDRDKAIRVAKLTTKQVSSHKAADRVAELLRQGRASEVTNDLLDQADPQRLHHHYVSGNTGMDMPMDQASRMERAAQMGFDTGNKLYHGGVRDFSSFIPSQSGKVGPGVYMTPNVRKANIFSGYEPDSNPKIEKLLNEGNEKSSQVYGLFATNRPATMEARQAVRTNESAYDDKAENYRKKFDEMGFDGVSVADERTILDPTNIRSQFARFDPRLSHLSHLSASTGGAMELARAVMAKNRAGGQIAPSKYMPNVPRAVHADGGRENGKAAFMQGNHPLVPNVLYHGSFPKIATKGWTDEVDEEQTQKIRDAQDFRTFKPSEYGNFGPGIYLSDSPTLASNFAQGIRGERTEALPHGQVFKLHVSMKNPFTDNALRHPAWKDYIKNEIKNALWLNPANTNNIKESSEQLIQKLDDGTATVRDIFLRDTPDGTMVNQFGQGKIHKTIRNSGFDGIIAHRPDGSKEYVAFKPEQVKSAIGNSGNFDPTDPDITKGNGGKVEGKRDFTQDNPGGEWLEGKQARASQYPDRKFVAGAITGVIGGRSSMFLPTHILKGIAGMNDETRTAGVYKYDDLLSDAQKGGFDHDQKGNKVVVAVNHYGQPYLLEGNTRVAVAHTLGIPKVKAEVRYWNGAENVDGPMHPDQVFGMASDSPDVTKSDGGEVVNLGKEKLVRSITKAASDVKSGAHQERMDQRAYKLHESGRLPLPIGTKVTPPQGWNMPSQLHIHGYWQDILHPEQHGYKLKSEDGDLYEVQHYTHSGQNPYIFGGGFKAYSGPVRNRAEYSDEAMASKNPAPSTKTPEQSSQINAEYDQLFGTDPDITKADGGEVDGDDDGITAYHGSPHSFDSFDISKLGTGEGAQAFGHGLYFAGNEKIAKHYRDALTTGLRSYTVDGVPASKLHGSLDPADSLKMNYAQQIREGKSHDDAINFLKTQYKGKLTSRFTYPEDIPYHKEQLARLEEMQAKPPEVQHLSGHMYKVKLNVKPYELLDWDKPLSEQPHVLSAIDERYGDPEIVMQQLGHDLNTATGRDFHDSMAGTMGDNRGAAQKLQDMGIKGIRYRDAGSRDLSDGDPTHNYVMFHHDSVKVTDKYEYGGTVSKATGGEIDGGNSMDDNNNVTDLSTVRTMRDINSGDHSYGAQNMFADLAEKYAASQKAFDMAHASGAFDNFQMGDMFKYNGLPNYDPEKIVGFTVKHVSSSPNMTKLFNNHYPALEFETQDADRKVTTVPLEWFENNLHKYDKVGGKPKLVKADGGSVNKALALTRGFTKDGKSAITALKPKRK